MMGAAPVQPPDDSFFDALRGWGTYIVAGISFAVGCVTVAARTAISAFRQTGDLRRDLDSLRRETQVLSARMDSMARDHADLRVAVAELPKRTEQQAQFDRLMEMMQKRG